MLLDLSGPGTVGLGWSLKQECRIGRHGGRDSVRFHRVIFWSCVFRPLLAPLYTRPATHRPPGHTHPPPPTPSAPACDSEQNHQDTRVCSDSQVSSLIQTCKNGWLPRLTRAALCSLRLPYLSSSPSSSLHRPICLSCGARAQTSNLRRQKLSYSAYFRYSPSPKTHPQPDSHITLLSAGNSLPHHRSIISQVVTRELYVLLCDIATVLGLIG